MKNKVKIKDLLKIGDQYLYSLANFVRNYLPFLTSSNQTAYVEGIFISEGGRLLSGISQVTDVLNWRGLVVIMGI